MFSDSTIKSQVEPNVRKIEEHRIKYERLQKERELTKAERERKQEAEPQVSLFVSLKKTNSCTFLVHWDEK